jgi:NADH-quinone oxidoreductase subunit M
MYDLPLLSMTIFLPLLGAFFVLLIREGETNVSRNARAVGLLTSLATLGLAIIDYLQFDPEQTGFQLVERTVWLEGFRIAYHVGVDGISILFVLLTALLMPIALVASWQGVKEDVRAYTACFLILETLIIGSFCALDTLLFYVFFEGVLIPMFLIIGIWGGERRVYSALKFFLYTLLGSVLMLVAIIAIYHEVGTTSIPELLHHRFDNAWQVWLWWAFFASFAVKAPMWPFHTWLPDAHVEAPTAGSVILAGILLKMGGYGFLRFSLPMFPEASASFAHLVFALSMVAVVYTSLIALIQHDMKKLIAYSSVAHMGLVTFGTFSGTLQGLQGAMFQMLSHGLVSAALFLCVGVLYDRLHTREISRYGGLARQMPLYAVAFFILILASIGLPATSGFVGEILVMMSAFEIKGWMAAILGLGMILGAAYALNLYRQVMLGKLEKPDLKRLKDLTFIERMVFVPLVALVLFLGIYPQPVFQLTESAVLTILKRYTIQPVKEVGLSTVEKMIEAKQA